MDLSVSERLDAPKAERCLADARMLAAIGEPAAALAAARRAVALAPGRAEAWHLRGELAALCRELPEAIESFARAVRLDPADRLGATLRLAALGAVAGPVAMPEAYLRDIFDRRAASFDAVEVEQAGYRAPWALAGIVREALRRRGDRRVGRMLDLGCGTGLAGEALRDVASWLSGVDLSPAMLAGAAGKSVYDTLIEADAVAALWAECEFNDLIVASGLLPYLGALDEFFTAVSASLVPGGLFAATAEAGAGEGFALAASTRFRHGPAYLRRAAEAAGLRILRLGPTPLRRGHGEHVAGLLLLAERPGFEEQLLDLEVDTMLGRRAGSSPTLQ